MRNFRFSVCIILIPQYKTHEVILISACWILMIKSLSIFKKDVIRELKLENQLHKKFNGLIVVYN